MSRRLRAERYAEGASPTLLHIITHRLPYLDFSEAMEFYSQAVPSLKLNEVALLGCNDRFFLLTGLLNRVDAIHPWIYDRAREVEANPDGFLDLWARFHYKDLSVETSVLTLRGWKRHGDLAPGDYVFGADGSPVRVVATRHFTDSRCYRIRLTGGVELVAGAGHLWRIEAPSRKRVSGTFVAGQSHGKRITRETRIVTTEELAQVLASGRSKRPGIKIASPLELPDRELPVDPYVLGAWLGDGFTSFGAICGIDPEVFERCELAGYALTTRKPEPSRHPDFRVRTVKGLTPKLRALGLIGNKHIPVEYLLASERQRRELLWGLIDTDGSVSTATKNACVTFASSSRRLAEEVQTLANSLGYKARLTPARTTKSWHVTFIAYADDPHPPCSLTRKRALLKDGGSRAREVYRSSGMWSVTAVEPIESVPTNCIQVDAPDGMYLAGRELIPTHNSSVITFAGATQEILIDPEIRIAIYANTKDIASPFVGQIMAEFEDNEFLKLVYSDVLWDMPRKQAPSWSKDQGITVKRSGNPRECTVEAHGLINALPTGKHFPILIYDDAINERNVTNPESIKKATERVELSFPTGIGEATRKWFVGTRYHYGDTYGHLIEHQIATPRLYPATDDGTINGTPVFMTPAAWEKTKREMRSQIAAQMLQNPVAGQENTFHTKWLRGYWVRPVMMNVYIMADPSKGKSATSDRTAIAVIGIDTQGNKFLLDGYCHRMPLSERWKRLKELHKKWSAMPGVQLVKVGYERYGAQSDEEYFDEKMRAEGRRFEIIELNWTGDAGRQSKANRVERLEPDFRLGSFFVPAKVWHTGVDGNEARWHLEEGSDEIHYRVNPGPHIQESRAKKNGEHWRVFDPIRRLDEDGNIYDLTRIFFEEFRFFPFSPRDDLIDAMSRIYDLDPMPAVPFESVPAVDYDDY